MLQTVALALILAEQPRGVVRHEAGAAPGYTLFSPFGQGMTYLVDLEGRVVHTWESRYEPGLAPYLLHNGNLLRGIQVDVPVQYEGGGKSGGLQEFSWDGELLWEFHLASDLSFHHHDIAPLPGGNVLMIAWEARTRAQTRAAGRRESHCGERGLWPEVIVEIEPLRPYGARVVWEWHAWDHLIQDTDPSLPDFGVVAEHPERIDINGDIPREPGDEAALTTAEQDALAALGYVDGDGTGTGPADANANGESAAAPGPPAETPEQRRQRERADWLHLNGLDYHPELDQIVVSSHQMNEVWILDHSTTTDEARTSQGGRRGKGGDLLYRWGNPQTYQCGSAADRQLFHQHDPQWIPAGFPGAGHLTLFNNGRRRPGEEYSTVLEIAPPLAADGTYARAPGQAFGPATPHWAYDPPGAERFYASFISGAHRLRNGNTLVCSGPQGRLLEVTPAGTVAWEYLNPFGSPPEDDAEDLAYGMFRATRIPPDHPALLGRVLTPLDPQPKTLAELHAERPARGPAASGWQPLFDADIGPSKWVNVNGIEGSTFDLRPDPERRERMVLISGKPAGCARSDRMYENFIVEFEWCHREEPGDAAFLVFADPLPAVGCPAPRGIALPISNRGSAEAFTSHGDIVPVEGAAMTPDPRFRSSGSRSLPREGEFHARPTGEWNHYRLTALDGAVTLEVNGHVVAAGSACLPAKGYLCLESRGSEVHFRDMRIWELPSGSHPAEPARTAHEARDLHPLFTGVDLTGWEVKSGAWTPGEARLHCAGGPAEIEAKLPAGTTELLLDFRRSELPPGGLLPFALGALRFPDPAPAAGEWRRALLRLKNGTVTLTLGEHHHTAEIPEGAPPTTLTLLGDGVPSEFCNLFANAEG